MRPVMSSCFVSLVWVAAQALADSQVVLNVQSYERDGDAIRVVLKSGDTIVVRRADFNDAFTKAIEKSLADQEAERIAKARSSPPSDAAARPLIETKCREEWGDDFKMQKYCQDQQYEGLRTLRSRQMAGSTLSSVRDKCAGEWNGDFKMREYCEQQQLKALEELRGR